MIPYDDNVIIFKCISLYIQHELGIFSWNGRKSRRQISSNI